MRIPFSLDYLSCVAKLENGNRCLGRLRLDDRDSLSCVQCHASYAVEKGVPILLNSEISDTKLSKFYSDVYTKQSRTRALHNDSARMQQAKVLWDLLPDLVHQRCITEKSLEIGCGVGIFAEQVPNYVGLDYAVEGLLAEGFEAFSRVCASGDLLPFQDRSFELIFTLNTLEHVPELDRCLQEIDRVLLDGGYLVLKPAWNCTQYNCDGVGYFPYNKLGFANKFKKVILPLLKSKLYKAITRIPRRLLRETVLRKVSFLFWKRLKPRFDLMYKVADSEAYASIDTHECIYWFLLKGYHCISHPTFLSRVCAGHDVVILRKK